MNDLKRYVAARKQRDGSFADGLETGYEQFKTRVVLHELGDVPRETPDSEARDQKNAQATPPQGGHL